MARRALILGSETGGLTGVSNDLQRIGSWLSSQGFEVEERSGDSATRAGIIGGVRKLVRDTQSGDAVLIYYSGHGGYVHAQSKGQWRAESAATPARFQYLVPTDHQPNRRFRGIFRAELSMLLRELTEKTRNVTAVLDCCHSEDMVRNVDASSKSIAEPWSVGLERHLEWLGAEGYDLARLSELRNPFVVLLAACAVDEFAYEYSRASDGARCGAFTDFLLRSAMLGRGAVNWTWATLMHEVTEQMLRWRRHQRPSAAGPIWRRLWSEEERRELGALRLRRCGGQWLVRGGRAVGVEVGDRYAISDADDPPRGAQLATVATVQSSSATLEIHDEAPGSLRPGLVARPCGGGPRRIECRVEGTGSLAAALRERLPTVPGLGLHDVSGDPPGEFSFRTTNTEVQVIDSGGALLRAPYRFNSNEDSASRDARIASVVDLAHLLTRSSRLRTLATRRTRAMSGVAWEWGRVDDDGPKPLPAVGAELVAGDRIYVKLENRRRRGRIYVSLLDIGVGWDVSLLTGNQPEGVMLGVGDRELLGQSELRPLRGAVIHWPAHVPPDGPREESIVAFFSDQRMPVESWVTTSMRGIGTTERRDLESDADAEVAVEYSTVHIRFLLHPRRAEKTRLE